MDGRAAYREKATKGRRVEGGRMKEYKKFNTPWGYKGLVTN